MVPLFVLILIAAVLWRQRHRPTATRLFVVTLDNGAGPKRLVRASLSGDFVLT